VKPRSLLYNRELTPRVSIILLDWSCRESIQSLEYLNHQSVPRELYEILWIEYYSRVFPPIRDGLARYSANRRPSMLDQWIVMGTPENICYHKHLMYNLGILASRGDIVCIADSDAIFLPTFVESMLRAFEVNREIVMHFDEIRNADSRFYPFNYPSIAEILGTGCMNWVNGKSRGMADLSDPLHLKNYGACMCARRQDLLDIGGADEARDYLGHICGPYEMTFRLMNAGKREVWHEQEYIYHVWHPGTGGEGDYLGPHDGRYMSSTALDIRTTGRIMPLEENPAIRDIRLGLGKEMTQEERLSDAIREEVVQSWTAVAE
jgi:hypothetical protein